MGVGLAGIALGWAYALKMNEADRVCPLCRNYGGLPKPLASAYQH